MWTTAHYSWQSETATAAAVQQHGRVRNKWRRLGSERWLGWQRCLTMSELARPCAFRLEKLQLLALWAAVKGSDRRRVETTAESMLKARVTERITAGEGG